MVKTKLESVAILLNPVKVVKYDIQIPYHTDYIFWFGWRDEIKQLTILIIFDGV